MRKVTDNQQTFLILLSNTFYMYFQADKLQSFLTEFLQKTGNENLIENFDMQPFDVNVLDRRRTLTEKLVSLLRCSLADNYMPELTAKIRHFYDLHFLLNDAETQDYLKSYAFKSDFSNLFVQDQQRFDKPEGWQNKDIMDSPIISDLHSVWSALSNVYAKELPDLAYNTKIYRVSRNLVGINFRHPNVMPNFAVWKTITYRHWHRWCCQPRF